METLFRQRLETLLQEWQHQLLQEWDQALRQPNPDLLWQWERLLLRLLMQLGGALVGLFVEAVHAQAERIAGWQQPPAGYRHRGWRWTVLTDLFGGRHRLRTPYAALDRRGRPGRRRGSGQRGAQGSGCFPVVERLGCRAGATPALLGEVASQLAWGPSQEVASQRLAERGIHLHPQTIRRLSYALADEGLKARQQALQQGRLPAGCADFEVQGKRVVITFDGGRIRMRYPQKGRRRASGYHGFEAPWQTPRLMVIYLIDAQGRALRQELPLYDGVLTSATQLFELLFGYLQALHLDQAQQVIFIADGAPEHWEAVTHLIEALGLRPQQVVEVLDWAHAVEHLTTVANLCGGWSSRQRQRWVQRMRTRLAHGQLQVILDELARLAQGRRAKAIHTESEYFLTHAQRMRYGHFRQRHIPLGSGAVESALRRVVNLRLKGAGIFWLEGNCQRMLFLRCQLLSGRWQRFLYSLFFTAPQQAHSIEVVPQRAVAA
jgi:hypothetical protein